ncbi:MAG TPA: hypothetical protein VJN89_11690 [Candidatus Acidoferrum sp.]|nr:hypothetical protein [Candidatus Acidoferrum sp.]
MKDALVGTWTLVSATERIDQGGHSDLFGQLPPDQVHTPGIFVDAIFQGPKYEKRIERRTTRKS